MRRRTIDAIAIAIAIASAVGAVVAVAFFSAGAVGFWGANFTNASVPSLDVTGSNV